MPPRFPPKGWCWHRDAKLFGLVREPGQLLQPSLRVTAIWHCPACQNVAQLVRTA